MIYLKIRTLLPNQLHIYSKNNRNITYHEHIDFFTVYSPCISDVSEKYRTIDVIKKKIYSLDTLQILYRGVSRRYRCRIPVFHLFWSIYALVALNHFNVSYLAMRKSSEKKKRYRLWCVILSSLFKWVLHSSFPFTYSSCDIHELRWGWI